MQSLPLKHFRTIYRGSWHGLWDEFITWVASWWFKKSLTFAFSLTLLCTEFSSGMIVGSSGFKMFWGSLWSTHGIFIRSVKPLRRKSLSYKAVQLNTVNLRSCKDPTERGIHSKHLLRTILAISRCSVIDSCSMFLLALLIDCCACFWWFVLACLLIFARPFLRGQRWQWANKNWR